MRERDKALAMGANAGYGRYVRLACPAYSHAWLFFGPLGGFMAWGTAVDLMHTFRGKGGLWHGWFAPFSGLMAVFLIGCCFVSRYERRTGGPTPGCTASSSASWWPPATFCGPIAGPNSPFTA